MSYQKRCTDFTSASLPSLICGRPYRRSLLLRERAVASDSDAREVRVCLTSTVNGRALRRFMCADFLETIRSET
jgi:hypothetical protein